jgi:hypothetical protein
MDEEGWLTACDPTAMWKLVQEGGSSVSRRRCRFFACACVRRVWSLLPDADCREAVEVTEGFADGKESVQRLVAVLGRMWANLGKQRFYERSSAGYARDAVFHAACDREAAVVNPAYGGGRDFDGWMAAHVAGQARHATVWKAGGDARLVGQKAWSVMRAAEKAEGQAQAALLRDLLGNLFRPPPAIDTSWLAWNDGTVKRLAEAAYEHRLLPSGQLDPVRLGVLADALEEAGADAALLGHLRDPGPHVRGCQVIDWLTGRQ